MRGFPQQVLKVVLLVLHVALAALGFRSCRLLWGGRIKRRRDTHTNIQISLPFQGFLFPVPNGDCKESSSGVSTSILTASPMLAVCQGP